MASIFRIGTTKLAHGCLSTQLCKAANTCSVVQVAFITRKAHRADRLPRPPPFPYKTKRFNVFNELFDPMMQRFDDNSKIVVVEGPAATGKKQLAKQLADELEMVYMPPPDPDDPLIDDDGFDIRMANLKLPESAQLIGLKEFLENPKHRNAQMFQMTYFLLRFSQYVDALLHLLSTGDGVVLDRCVFSQAVYLSTWYQLGYLSKLSYRYLNDYLKLSRILEVLLRPHLIVYLDLPPEEVRKRIEKRGIPYEVNSPCLTLKNLTLLDNNYKKYLQDIEQHAHVLMYSAQKEIDFENIVQDIEELDFDSPNLGKEKMDDWTFSVVDEVRALRRMLQNKEHVMNTECEPMMTEIIEELMMDIEDQELLGTEIVKAKRAYELSLRPHHTMAEKQDENVNVNVST